jgi:hypothetical protein
MQTEIALSTMEAEYIALSTSCRNFFPLIDITNELCTAFQVEMQTKTQMHIKIHEDNIGALTLGKLKPQRITPRSKHYAIKYHWFLPHPFSVATTAVSCYFQCSLRCLCHLRIFCKILSLCCWLRHPISEVPHGLSRHYLAEPFHPKVLLTYAFSRL